jgi:hypothetical protein
MPNAAQATTTRETTMSNFHFARVMFASAITSATISLAFTNLVYAQSAATGAAAQPGNGPTTRASDKADLKNLENHGYKPTASESNYPNDIQKAEKATYGSGATGANGATATTNTN